LRPRLELSEGLDRLTKYADLVLAIRVNRHALTRNRRALGG
jgi:hypothetical protein